MNSYYEFISRQQDQMISVSQRANSLRSSQEQRYGIWGKFIDRCGDLLIESGSRMKRIASSSESVGIYSQN